MHELSIATELYVGLRSEIDGRGGGRLRAATIAVGELASIEPDLLRFAWEAVTATGPDEGATLEIEWHAVIQRCPACGVIPERVAGSWLRLCPNCSEALLLEGGRELEILSMAYDEPEPLEPGSARSEMPVECKT